MTHLQPSEVRYLQHVIQQQQEAQVRLVQAQAAVDSWVAFLRETYDLKPTDAITPEGEIRPAPASWQEFLAQQEQQAEALQAQGGD